MRIYNTQTHQKEELTPIEPGKIRMYTCGPTVYDNIHIGNGRTFLAFDAIRRYLQYQGFDVTFAQNLTDVDDKIIARAAEKGVSPAALAAEYSDAFIEQMHRLNVQDPTIRPRATQEIPAMIAMIEHLVEEGHAYVAPNGDVYFAVRSDGDYGEVSGRNLDELLAGARIEQNEDKRDPADFALWKAAKPGEPSWESPWGQGRPGWHTECSAMVHRYLGTPIDIHGGGQDLVFPHHENEAAQARCCWHEPLANVWMHTGMLRVNGEKMSKSLGNFYTLREVLDAYPGDALRLLFLQTHDRSPLDFSYERLDGAVGSLERIKNTVRNLRWAAQEDAATSAPAPAEKSGEVAGAAAVAGAPERDAAFAQVVDAARGQFEEQMDDDFNTAGALAVIFNLVTVANTYLDEAGTSANASLCLRASDTLIELLEVLGITSVRPLASELPQELVALAAELAGAAVLTPEEAAEALVAARAQARAERDWPRADAIRDAIQALGLTLEDTATGTRIIPAKE
jgi:cysteinyl-tRNA synthetase